MRGMSDKLPTIKIENYEGPFDLLLELARAKKMDLATINLRDITEGFLEYVRNNTISPKSLGDFLVVASTLLLLKVSRLLPQPQTAEPQIQHLTDRLRIYQLYREQADVIRRDWGKRPLLRHGYWGNWQAAPAHSRTMPGVTSDDLNVVMNQIVDRLPQPPQPARQSRARGRSLQECLDEFAQRLQQERRLIFQDEIATVNRHTAAVSFLAILEMSRGRQATLKQDAICGELVITQVA